MKVNSVDVFGVPVFSGSYDTVLDWLLAPSGRFRRVVTLNPIIFEQARTCSKELEWISSADLIVPDGMGICMAMKRRHGVCQRSITGVQLVHDILSKTGKKIYFVGATSTRLKKAVQRVESKFSCTVVGAHDGYFSDEDVEEVLGAIQAEKPDFIFVGMGYPRQEWFIRQLSGALDDGVAIGVGGVIDVLSGEVAWAPMPFRRVGLEWLYRMLKEPRRLKQLPLVIRFLFRMFFR
jgi:N-acetylglucosaminyldiphosphoundecaprenol N-acetyl-beta-D-mannosaminyltransferase